MSNIRNLPMTIGIVILVIAFVSSLRRPDHRNYDRRTPDGAAPVEMELEEMRAINRSKLRFLSVTMTKEEAVRTMGTRTFVDEDDDDFLVSNPYRTESYQAPDGTVYELLSYYTDRYKSDGKLTKEEMTPLIFENGKLIGWGWVFFDKLDLRHATVPAPAPPAPPAPVLPEELPAVEK